MRIFVNSLTAYAARVCIVSMHVFFSRITPWHFEVAPCTPSRMLMLGDLRGLSKSHRLRLEAEHLWSLVVRQLGARSFLQVCPRWPCWPPSGEASLRVREPPILNALAAASDFSQQRSETRSLPILYSHSSGKNFKQKTSSKNYSCPHFRGGDPRWLQ